MTLKLVECHIANLANEIFRGKHGFGMAEPAEAYFSLLAIKGRTTLVALESFRSRNKSCQVLNRNFIHGLNLILRGYALL